MIENIRPPLVVAVVVLIITLSGSANSFNPQCPSEIFCHGELLHTVQMSRINADSKTFVDMKLRQSPNITLDNFRIWQSQHPEPSQNDVRAFVQANFEEPGSEFEYWVPDDYVENPRVLDAIRDPDYYDFARELNRLWLVLGRKMIDDVAINSELYSIIPVANPVIVPGGRFREFYYWDSYWIMLGLLASEMFSTTKGMLENFVSLVERNGFIPNGGRIYYEGRSQPPLLIPMVHEYVEATDDWAFVRDNINTLAAEFDFWRRTKSIQVNGHTVAMYGDQTTGPRPESYAEDFESGSFFGTPEEVEHHYSELKAAAESGMDFSSRWFITDDLSPRNGSLVDLQCRSIVPVELNAILYWNANILAEFYRALGNETEAERYEVIADEIQLAVHDLFWHEDVGAWLDWDLENGVRRDFYVASNLAPLWTNCFNVSDREHISERVISYVDREQLDKYMGGLPNTLEHSGEQWDFPNVWPPMQHMIIMGLNNLDTEMAGYTAYRWANRWVLANYAGFERTGFMFEKYSAEVSGSGGVGGEYDLQVGFGWTNGVILDLFRIYGGSLTKYPRDV